MLLIQPTFAAANTYINFSMIYEYYYVIPEEGTICNVKRWIPLISKNK